MKRDRLFTGMFLLWIGILFLLDNFNVISFHWGNIIGLWPLLLIMSGINLVFKHYDSSGYTPIRIAIFSIILAIVAYRGIQPADHNLFGKYFGKEFFNDDNGNINIGGDDDDNDGKKEILKVEGNSVYNIPYLPTVKVASLNIKGGGATYTLKDTTNRLFSAATHELTGKFVFNSTATDSSRTINFDTNNANHSINWDSDKGNQANIKLNPNPEWNIDIAAGASKMDLDLIKFKIRTLLVKGGATSMDVKLGQPVGIMNVDISTGVSEVNISVPASAACHINSKTGLSSKTFDGFEAKSNNQYETAGFAAAPKKIYINLKGGISDFSVKRY